MKVRGFCVGPILGATTPTSARIFGRGEFEAERGRPRRAHAVVRIRNSGNRQFNLPRYSKLNPNFDMTAVTVFQDLEPDTLYDYQAGYIFSDVDTADIDVAKTLDWSEVDTHTFRTASDREDKPRKIVLGSCRYLLRFWGGNMFDDRGDKTFRSIGRKIGNKRNTHALLMVGDQIYADDLSFINPDDTVGDYIESYPNPLMAWGTF